MSEPTEGRIYWNEDGVYWAGKRIEVDWRAADMAGFGTPAVLFWMPVRRFRRPGRSPFRRRRRGRA